MKYISDNISIEENVYMTICYLMKKSERRAAEEIGCARNTIINVRNSKDIQSFLDSINKENIEEEITNLMTEFKKYGDNYCRKCGLCYPCAVNMNIPRMLEINKELNDGDYSPIEEFYSYDKNASDCIRCGACEMRCPFSVPVRQIHIDTVGLIERYIDGNKEK